MWNNKKVLSKEQVYGKEMDSIVDNCVYFEDSTCIEMTEKCVKFFKLRNPFSIEIPLYKWEKVIHREDGPAVENLSNLDGCPEFIWFIDGKRIKSIEYFDRELTKVKKYIDADKNVGYYSNGNLKWEILYVDGTKTKDVSYHENGNVNRLYLYDENEYRHSETGPAYQEFHSNGKLCEERWYINGKLHRIGEPAIKKYYSNGNLKEENWYEEGDNKRKDDENTISKKYYENGTINYEYFQDYDSDFRQCTKGPYRKDYDKKRKLINKVYYIDNENVSFLYFWFKTKFKK